MESFQRLEAEFARFVARPVECTVACSSGTAALHLALETLRARLDWKDGNRVIVPTFTMAACARAVSLAGLEPVFVGCGSDLLLNLDDVDEATKLSGKAPVVAVMPVHVYGRRVPMNRLANWAVSRGIAIVEDLAEAHGVPPHDTTDAACYSFYRNKIVAGEEGGAVAFNSHNAEDGVTSRQLRSLGFGPTQDYWHRPRGHNYRLANALADKIIPSLERYARNRIDRQLLWNAYDAQSFGPRYSPRAEPEAKWVYDLRLKGMDWIGQAELVSRLKSSGVDARQSFKPLHLQEEYKGCRYVGDETAERESRESLYLPLTPHLVTERTVKTAARVIREITSGW